MEKRTIQSFNRQLSRMYSLAILHIFISIIGLALNYLRLHSEYLYCGIITLNVVALYCFQPWKIMACLNEGYGYQQGLEAIAEQKGVTNV